jgi:hypothetical protein
MRLAGAGERQSQRIVLHERREIIIETRLRTGRGRRLAAARGGYARGEEQAADERSQLEEAP